MTKYTHTHVDINISTQSAISDFFFFFKYVKVTAWVSNGSLLCTATSSPQSLKG